MSMNRLAAMDAFVRVVDTGSFTAAARQLRVGQPAVSKMIAQLEQHIGVKLLLRTTQGLKPTEAGENFFEHAKRSVEEADEAVSKARGIGAALTGRLRISGAVTFARLHIVPRLPRFMSLHPALDIEMLLDDGNVDLVEAGIDVALRMGDLRDSSLTARRIGYGPRVVLAAPAYVAARGEPQTPADLIEHEAVIYDQRGGGTMWSFRQGASEQIVTIKGRMRSNAAEAVREAVFAGMGLAVASEWMFDRELAAGTVRRVLSDWELPPVGLWVVFPSGRNASMKARAFAKFIEEDMHADFGAKGVDRPELATEYE
jgi:DNA-binding transcriptional LysR family regulator